MSIALYGRTYWDVEISLDFETLRAGKGKVDIPTPVVIGGFAANAARTIGAIAGAPKHRVVTVCATADVERLRAALPEHTQVHPILTDNPHAMPDISVIFNPARDCRILRDPGDSRDSEWRIDSIPDEVWQESLHVFGRVPQHFAEAAMKQISTAGKRIAWCGGSSLSRSMEATCDVLCVNTSEAMELLGAKGSPSTEELARGLAARAKTTSAIRLVTGRGATPTVAAIRDGDAIASFACEPADVSREEIVSLLGVGDCFAASFLVASHFAADASILRQPDVSAGLIAARAAAAHFLTHESPRGGAHA